MRAAGYRHAHNYIGRKISFERKKSAPAYNRTCFPTQMVFLRAEGGEEGFFGVFKLFSSSGRNAGVGPRWQMEVTQYLPPSLSRLAIHASGGQTMGAKILTHLQVGLVMWTQVIHIHVFP